MRRLEKESFPGEDKELILKFIDHLKVKGISIGRMAKYLFTIMVLRRHLECTFKQAGRKEIEKLVAWINTEEYTPHTKSDMKEILRLFYKFIRFQNTDKKTPYPQEVEWIEAGMKKNERSLPEILTEDEVTRMIENAPLLRDKAFISFMYESGFRIGEALGIIIRDLEFNQHGVKVRVKGKTGERRILLVSCASLLTQYLNNHPLRNDPDAPLWIHYGQRNRFGALSYPAAAKLLRETVKRAGISKRIHPHIFRHSAATRDAKYLTQSELCAKYGWTFSSRMASVYIHLAGSDLDSKIIAINTGKPLELKPEFVPVLCPRCNEKNTPGQRYCGKCGTPLNKEELAKSSIELEELKIKLDEVLRKISEFAK